MVFSFVFLNRISVCEDMCVFTNVCVSYAFYFIFFFHFFCLLCLILVGWLVFIYLFYHHFIFYVAAYILMRSRKKMYGFGWVGKEGGSGRSWVMENFNQNILY